MILTIVVTALAAIGLDRGVFAGFQRRATDSLLPAAADSNKVVVVGFDRATIDKYGNPLPRSEVGLLTKNLAAAGARVIAFDVIYSQVSKDPADDAALASAIDTAGNVILGRQVTLRAEGAGNAPKVESISPVANGDTSDPLATAQYGNAHVQVNADPTDGINRSLPLIVELPDGTFLPSLSLASVMAYRGVAGPPIVRPDGVQIGDRFVPTGGAKSLLLNFTSKLSDTAPGQSHVISAADVLAGTVPRSRIAGKIVLVGAISSTLGDQRLAPVNKESGIPGVLLHANAINTMLTGDYLEPVSHGQTLIWVALLAWLIAVAVLMLPLWLSPIVTLALGFGYFALAVVRFENGTVLDFVYPLITVVLAFIGAVGLRYFGETRQRRRVTALFAQYVPEAVAQQLVDQDRATTAAEGERLDMTVLFCDLRGFTAMSEKLEPTTVRVMLNHYYDRVTDLVLGMSGTLMKYVGDEVFAVWGAPLPTTDHPTRALACAIAIQDLVPELNRELVEMGAPEVAFGIGLNTGEAVAAHFGGGRRRQYDVVGDTVNVGARLCSAAGRGEIILSDAVLTRVSDPPEVEPLGPIELKGVSRELRLWRVVRPDSATLRPSERVAVAAGAAPGAAGARGGSEDGAEQVLHDA